MLAAIITIKPDTRNLSPKLQQNLSLEAIFAKNRQNRQVEFIHVIAAAGNLSQSFIAVTLKPGKKIITQSSS